MKNTHPTPPGQPRTPGEAAPADMPHLHSAPPARLALEDGSVFLGRAFGAGGQGIAQTAEVVFNTAMLGYQEALTDPSYTGQILVMTAPLIGNTGVNAEDEESGGVKVAGMVVRELARRHSNYRATESLSDYLRRQGVLGIEGVDTRAITRRLRTAGAMRGVLTDRTDLSDEALVAMARGAPSMSGQNLVRQVGCAAAHPWSEDLGPWAPAHLGEGEPSAAGGAPVVLALDCGAKSNILRNLAHRGCEVRVVPHDITPGELHSALAGGQADGLFISNGPGDPAAVERTIETLRAVLDDPALSDVPVFGICLGHQLLALAIGARTYKLKFGHRGANQPVLNRATGRVEITSQNHGFAVDPESLEAAGGRITHVHLNDGTVAGFEIPDRPIFSVQYHPEASPGPHDSAYLFDRFAQLARQRQSRRAGDEASVR